MRNKYKILVSLFLALILLLGFSIPLNLTNGWYQQFMPNLDGKQITDITFLDSLNGYAVATQTSDSSCILKTMNGGNNWQIIHRQLFSMTRIQFLNINTGYACGSYLYKTTNGGFNWNQVNTSGIAAENMYILNEDTIWLTDANSLVGGVFRTTNGGTSWQQQLSLGSQNPEKIYMFNSRIGFISKNMGSSGYVRKTTDGGASWQLIVNNDYYLNIHFVDSLTGWKNSAFGMKKTTNGGLNWTIQLIPSGGIIQNSFIYDFSVINRDTLWGCGGYVLYPNNQTRGILYRTVNGGTNWLFQIPDTSIDIGYEFVRFTDGKHGWIYDTYPSGIHTNTSGDPVFYTSIKQVISSIPENYKLYQNYPNPFNPSTTIKFQIEKLADVKLNVYDITGKLISTIVENKNRAGVYEINFNGSKYSSGIYFYSLFIDNKIIDTKRMILIK
jgi:hypothetical protein